MTLVRLIDEKHHNREFHSYIYKPIIAQYVDQTMQHSFYQSKDFAPLAGDYFHRFDFTRQSRQLLNAICDLNYDRDIEGQTPVKDFKLIDEYDTEGLYILTTPEIQEEMSCLKRYLSSLQEQEMTEDKRSKLLLEIETIKAELKDYQLSLRKNDLKNYEDTDKIKGEAPYRYIAYEDQVRYAYDQETGFLKEPREQIPGNIHY